MKQSIQTDIQNQISLTDLGVSVPEIELLPNLPQARKGTASSSQIHYKDFGALSLADYEIFSQLPEHPLWSKVEQLIDFSFADELCAHLYSPNGQRPYAPSLKLKLHLVQAMENLSDREMEVRLMFDMAIKRFVGVPMSFSGFDHSTLGLNRHRMGDELFHACFHYILAQAKAYGLWGKPTDNWLVDSFHTMARASRMGALRLVKQGMLNILQHLKRTHLSLFNELMKDLDCTTWFERLPREASTEEQMAACSLLITQAHALLSWLEHGHAHQLFWQWTDKKQQLRALELQALLCLILQQNTRPLPDGTSPEKKYEKMPKKERPTDRIVNAHFPDLRNGYKSAKQPFTGDKIQVVESSDSGFILEIEPIPGNEHDGERLSELVASVIAHHETSPEWVTADAAYGHGRYRARVTDAPFELVAPIVDIANRSGLFEKDQFQYDEEQDKVTCPNGNTTYRKGRIHKEEGYQYFFKAKDCSNCPLKEKCTNTDKGRSIFISDHHKLVEEAKARNETKEGQTILKERWKIERTNNELANHHELRRPNTCDRNALRIIAKLKAIAVNIKIIVRKLGSYREDPFVRKKRRQRGAAACAA